MIIFIYCDRSQNVNVGLITGNIISVLEENSDLEFKVNHKSTWIKITDKVGP